MSLKLKIAANTLVQIIGKLVSAGVTFLITILVAREFGVEGFGEFTKITVYVALFYLVADFGLNAVTLKEMSREEEKTGYFFANLLALRLVFALILIFLSLGILALLPYGSEPGQGFTRLVRLGIIFLSLTILTQAIFTTANTLFQKNLRYDKAVIASSLGSLATLGAVALFIFLGGPLLLVILGFLFGGGVMAITALVLTRSRVGKLTLSFDFSFWRKLFLASLPLGLTLIFNLIYFRADTFILTIFRPTQEVGFYGLAYKFFELPLALPIFFMNSLYPLMLSYAPEKEKLKKLVRNVAYFLFFCSLVGVLFGWFLAPLLTLIKADFSASILAFRILILSLPLFFLSALFMWTLITLGKQNLLVAIYGFSLIFNLTLNLIFIPRYGYLAAAVTTGVSELVVLTLTGYFGLKFLKGERHEGEEINF